jgi:hypothetical protein
MYEEENAMVRVLLAIAIVVLMAFLAWTILVHAYHAVHVGDNRPAMAEPLLLPSQGAKAFV